MSINSYKLVPVKMFEDLTKNRQSPVENNRSIKSIIEESNQKYSTPSLESIIDNSNKYSTSCLPQQMSTGGKQMKYIEGYWDIEPNKKYPSTENLPQQLGEGRKLGSGPLWVYDDQTTLPNYSQGKKVSDSFESYKNMLDNNTVPEHTKIQLLQFLKDKYDGARRPYETLDPIDEEDDDDDHNGNGEIIHSIISSMGPDKRRKAMDIVSVFLNNKNLIRWNSEGDLTLPNFAGNLPINLASLLKILVYANEGTAQEIQSAIYIVKPFFKTIKEHVANRKIFQPLEDIQDEVSKRYIALKSTPKKKNKKNDITEVKWAEPFGGGPFI